MFTPFGALMNAREQREGGAPVNGAEGAGGHTPAADEEIADLKAQLEAMRRQIDELANRK
jgi:hypothetical protein